MLVVKVELWPFGSEEQRKEIGRLDIWNRGFFDGSYGYALYKDGETAKRIREGVVEGFDRRKHTAYDLLQLVLDEALGEPYESGWLERQYER